MTDQERSQLCPICVRPAADPCRHYVDGKITEGCCDAFHTGHLVPISNSSHWHNRKEAKQIRRQLAKRYRLK